MVSIVDLTHESDHSSGESPPPPPNMNKRLRVSEQPIQKKKSKQNHAPKKKSKPKPNHDLIPQNAIALAMVKSQPPKAVKRSSNFSLPPDGHPPKQKQPPNDRPWKPKRAVRLERYIHPSTYKKVEHEQIWIDFEANKQCEYTTDDGDLLELDYEDEDDQHILASILVGKQEAQLAAEPNPAPPTPQEVREELPSKSASDSTPERKDSRYSNVVLQKLEFSGKSKSTSSETAGVLGEDGQLYAPRLNQDPRGNGVQVPLLRDIQHLIGSNSNFKISNGGRYPGLTDPNKQIPTFVTPEFLCRTCGENRNSFDGYISLCCVGGIECQKCPAIIEFQSGVKIRCRNLYEWKLTKNEFTEKVLQYNEDGNPVCGFCGGLFLTAAEDAGSKFHIDNLEIHHHHRTESMKEFGKSLASRKKAGCCFAAHGNCNHAGGILEKSCGYDHAKVAAILEVMTRSYRRQDFLFHARALPFMKHYKKKGQRTLDSFVGSSKPAAKVSISTDDITIKPVAKLTQAEIEQLQNEVMRLRIENQELSKRQRT